MSASPMTLNEAINVLQQLRREAYRLNLGEAIYLKIAGDDDRIVSAMKLVNDGSGLNNYDVVLTLTVDTGTPL